MASGDPLRQSRVPEALLGALLVLAPLYLGGNRPAALVLLELIAIAGLAWLAWTAGAPPTTAPLLPALRWAIGLLVAVPLVQLVPLPAEWWAALPGREPYVRALEVAGDAARGQMRPLSIHPRATQYSALVILPCLAAFLLTLAQPRRRVHFLAITFVLVAVAEAALGIMQLGAAPGSPLHFGQREVAGIATGTYVNRNHFAALMAMALPCALVLWFMETMPHRHRASAEDVPHRHFSDRRLARQIVLALPVVFLAVALLFSRSRGGIGAGLLGLGIVSLVLVWRAATVPAKLAFSAIALGALALGAYIGLTPVIERFAPEAFAVSYAGRLQIAAASVRGGLDFLPLGSGLGTYADAFRRYQFEGLPGFVDHAHNDYAEFFLELGVAAVAIAALAFYAWLQRWVEIVRGWHYRGLEHLQVAAGLGMLAMLVHGTVDFNFHIPANAIYFSFLAGVFFYRPARDSA